MSLLGQSLRFCGLSATSGLPLGTDNNRHVLRSSRDAHGVLPVTGDADRTLQDARPRGSWPLQRSGLAVIPGTDCSGAHART